MGLTTYRRKRRFPGTPEPEGKSKKTGRQLRFVVQKHHASRLHYDFRLELDGVLKSWAVPKGPSLNPRDKRLAMMVEDHPFDYRTFEGTIPKGNYGAGTVMVWDEGTYEAYQEPHPAKGLKALRQGLQAGDLKFTLRGTKLKGSYALVRTKGRGDNSWLLIKKTDDHAAEGDVTFHDRSALSGRTLEEISEGAEGRKKVRHSNRGFAPSVGTDPMPKQVKPMLATLVDAPFDREGWVFETKWDGYRAIAEAKEASVKLYSRNRIDFTGQFAPVTEILKSLGYDAVLDGEVVVLEKGRSSFQALQNYRRTGKGKLTYAVFDLLYLDGHDIRGFPLRDRKDLLCRLVKGIDGLHYSSHIEHDGIKAYRKASKSGEEGIIAKDAESPYVNRRSGNWLKMKTSLRQEAVIGGFTAPRGSRRKFGSLLLGVYDGSELRYIGHTGGGFDDASLSGVHAQLKPLARKTSPFSATPKANAPVTWVKPEVLCEVKFQEWTGDGHMRQPVFLGLREDKPPRMAVKEEPAKAETVTGTGDKPAQEQALQLDGHRLKLTNLSKTFWPDEGHTKGDVIAYYREMAGTVLPYLKDRPQSLNRHPNGIDGPSFYQKDMADTPPPWVKTRPIYSESNDKDLNWLVCQDEATLVYLANLGCIELNPWHSRLRKLDHPDYLLLDLDAKDVGFESVIKVAREVRKVLEEAGVESYPKTSGKSGLHVCLPLGGKYGYEQSKQFARLLVTLAHERLPKLTSLERSPEKRKGLIYLDYLQNRRGQTMAAPYALRPVPGATVSTPLRWEEVKKGLDPQSYTIKTIHKRLERTGDLWKGVLGPGIDLGKCLDRMA